MGLLHDTSVTDPSAADPCYALCTKYSDVDIMLTRITSFTSIKAGITVQCLAARHQC